MDFEVWLDGFRDKLGVPTTSELKKLFVIGLPEATPFIKVNIEELKRALDKYQNGTLSRVRLESKIKDIEQSIEVELIRLEIKDRAIVQKYRDKFMEIIKDGIMKVL